MQMIAPRILSLHYLSEFHTSSIFMRLFHLTFIVDILMTFKTYKHLFTHSFLYL